MARISKLLSEDIASLAELGLKKLGKYGCVAARLQIILAASKHSITEVCKIHGISRTTLTDWIKRLRTGEVDALMNKSKASRSPLTQHESTIKLWIEGDPNLTVRELLIRVKDELGVTISQTAMRRVIQKLQFAYITPRPRHHKQTPESHAEFKKKSNTDS